MTYCDGGDDGGGGGWGGVMVVEMMVMEVMMVEVEVGSHDECPVLRLLGCAAESLQRDSIKRQSKVSWGDQEKAGYLQNGYPQGFGAPHTTPAFSAFLRLHPVAASTDRCCLRLPYTLLHAIKFQNIPILIWPVPCVCDRVTHLCLCLPLFGSVRCRFGY